MWRDGREKKRLRGRGWGSKEESQYKHLQDGTWATSSITLIHKEFDLPFIKKAKRYTDWHVKYTQRNWVTVVWGMLVKAKGTYAIGKYVSNFVLV